MRSTASRWRCRPKLSPGVTAPATLAGLLAQENAGILAHITLAQIFRPGTPVLYGTVSTIANMRLGTVALGAVETGLITAASAQMARYYGLPSRSVGAATESKREDLQAGMERTATLVQAVLAGVNFITCAGTLDGTMLESEPLLLLDDELCGAALRMARGIEVTDDTLALDLIRRVGYGGNYFAENHTVDHYRSEHYIPRLAVRETVRDVGEERGPPRAGSRPLASARSWRAISPASLTRRWHASSRITARWWPDVPSKSSTATRSRSGRIWRLSNTTIVVTFGVILSDQRERRISSVPRVAGAVDAILRRFAPQNPVLEQKVSQERQER